MIISVEEAKKLVDFKNWTDEKLSRKLKSIEQTIRQYTNNNFQKVSYRRTADIVGSLFVVEALTPFRVGDTVQISESAMNNGLYTVIAVDDSSFTVEEIVVDEPGVLATKVSYPEDVIDCAITLLEWSINHGSKVGIKSETLSRHSVTYEDSGTLFNGYPVGILNGLQLYRKARC